MSSLKIGNMDLGESLQLLLTIELQVTQGWGTLVMLAW
jgi:hypothetical protein